MPAQPRFKSAEGEANFLSAYNRCLALWPVAHEAIKVSTSVGETHVNVAGSQDLPPMVLIHGAQTSSTVWYPNVEALSKHFCIYAPDVVDQLGISSPSRKLQSNQDYADWLCEVMDGLKIERAVIVGHSQGGWQAINMAILKAERIEKLVLLAPAPAIAQMNIMVLLKMLPIFIRPSKGMFYGYMQWMTTMPLGDEQPIVELFIIGAKAFTPGVLSFGATSVFSDDDLRQIKMPTLLLVGEKEVVYEAKKVLERARRLIPQIEAEIIQGGGHLFLLDQAEATNARILEFLKQ